MTDSTEKGQRSGKGPALLSKFLGRHSSVEPSNYHEVEIAPLTNTTHSTTHPKWHCPHCRRQLAFDDRTECDNCGAHLRLLVETLAAPDSTE